MKNKDKACLAELARELDLDLDDVLFDLIEGSLPRKYERADWSLRDIHNMKKFVKFIYNAKYKQAHQMLISSFKESGISPGRKIEDLLLKEFEKFVGVGE